MKEFIDRVPTYPNKKVIMYEDGTSEMVTIENADEAIHTGTPINRNTMMALQGFEAKTTEVKSDGSIVRTNSEGHTLTISPLKVDGTKTITFVGEKTIVLTATFNVGIVTEVLS